MSHNVIAEFNDVNILNFYVDSYTSFSTLERHFDKVVGSEEKQRILFPLCGKTVDMKWYVFFHFCCLKRTLS